MILQIEAPTDAQLRYIADLCEQRGLRRPAAVASKKEASEIVSKILDRTYDPAEYEWPFGEVPF